ncbi:MarR family winged helix-turn-helix transcriptional regulator [Peribacillus sp. NPDC096622]|uniref:MarR family winged helix-turn-helix transcriptional regulator n=1 Tax=Bacillaceae TaxID=186817 RepID=UPI0003794CE3|nr:MarR family transcriptional regulator [Bacillus bingmayongensis]MBY0596514.1 MarR family transcriptional regulator [Bacillus bingmayongensis]
MSTDNNNLDINIDNITKELALAFGQLRRVGHVFNPSNGLRQSELNLLVYLTYLCPPGTTGIKVSDLSKQLKITSAAVTHVIQSLEKNGYITRTMDPSDRRSILLSATKDGHDFVEAREKELFERFHHLSEHLGADDAQQLIRILTKSIRFLSTYQNSDEVKP